MRKLLNTMESFWEWTGLGNTWGDSELDISKVDPLYCPEFEELRNVCISSINLPLSPKEINAFLLCMAFDSEEEYILDACREFARPDFLEILLQTGITFPHSEARWQMAELLKRDIPLKENYLRTLLDDSDPYVRKRANNTLMWHPR